MLYNSQIETFIDVVEAGSFSKAAKGRFITTSAIIKQINSLESALQLKLFERTHRGLILTKAGQLIYKDAQYIINFSREAVRRAHDAETESFVIRLGVSPITPADLVIDFWPKVVEVCPDLRLELVPYENTPENAREILANFGRRIDVVVGVFDEHIGQRGAGVTVLEDTPLMLGVSVQNVLSARDKLSIKDLEGSTLLVPRQGWNHYFDKVYYEVYQNNPKINLKTFNFLDLDVFNQAERLGGFVLSTKLWKNVHPFIKMREVDWSFTTQLGLLHNPNPPEHVKKFLSVIQSNWKKRREQA